MRGGKVNTDERKLEACWYDLTSRSIKALVRLKKITCLVQKIAKVEQQFYSWCWELFNIHFIKLADNSIEPNYHSRKMRSGSMIGLEHAKFAKPKIFTPSLFGMIVTLEKSLDNLACWDIGCWWWISRSLLSKHSSSWFKYCNPKLGIIMPQPEISDLVSLDLTLHGTGWGFQEYSIIRQCV